MIAYVIALALVGVVAVPGLMLMGFAWKELQGRTANTPNLLIEQAREERRRSNQIALDLAVRKKLTGGAPVFTPRSRKLRIARTVPPNQAPNTSGHRPARLG